MYNGIGLATARGSGTNGYVQRNWAAIKKVKDNTSFKTDEELSKIDSAANRQPNQELLDHDRKRRVELKCIELEQSLEDQGYSQDEISKKINSFRVTLLGKPICGTEYDERGRPIMKDSHQFADEQLKKNARLRDAFGISEFFIEGSSLDPERKTKEAAMAQLKSLQVLQVDQTVEQTHMNDDTSTNKDSSIANELWSKSPKHKKRKKKKTKSHKTDKEKGSDKKKSKKHKKKHNSSSEDSPRNDTKISKSSFQVKSKNDDDRSNKVTTENNKKKYESENNHKKHLRDNDKSYKNDKKEVENKYKSDREDYRKKDSKSDNFKSSKKDKSTEESHKSKSKDAHESKKQDSSPRHKTPIKERARDRDRGYDKYSYRHQRKRDSSKSNKEKSDKKSDKGDNKYSSKKKNESPVKEVKKPIVQYEKLTCISSDSEKSCYTPPPKDMKAKHAKLNQSKSNEDKNVKSTKYTFSLREDNDDDDRLVVTKANGRTDNLKPALQNSENQHKKTESRKTNDRVDKIFLDSTSSEEGDLEEDIDLNIIKEITTEKIKKVFELHEKQEQALLHLKKKIMEKKHKVRTSSSSSESSEVEPVKKKSVKRRRARDSSSSNSDVNTRKKTKRSRSSSSSSNASDTSVDRRKSSSKRRSTDKYSKKKSPKSRRHTKGSTSRSRSRSASLSSNERSRKKRVSSSEESSPRHKRKSSKRKRSSRRQRSSDSSSSSRSSSSYKKKRRYSSSRSRSTSSSSMSSHYSRSSSSSHDSSSSVFSRSSKSRSASIPRRRGSPSFLDRRRITSARKRPIPYTRLTPFSTNSDTDSVISVHDSPFAEPLTWN